MDNTISQDLLSPPWIRYPEIPWGSMGWRMGNGELHWLTFTHWFENLTTQEKETYSNLFPEPKEWFGFYSTFQNGTDTPSQEEIFDSVKHGVTLWTEEGRAEYSIEGLITKNDTSSEDYLLFWGHQPAKNGQISQTCLSQWWLSDFSFSVNKYHCMEQYMMAEKARIFGDEIIQSKIMRSNNQKQIKDLGRKVAGFDSTVWDEVKFSIVLNGNYYKFTQNKVLRDFLLSTDDKLLVEASPYDRIWGIGLAQTDEHAKNPAKWRGQNLLGFALMQVRDEIRRVYQNIHLLKDFQ